MTPSVGTPLRTHGAPRPAASRRSRGFGATLLAVCLFVVCTAIMGAPQLVVRVSGVSMEPTLRDGCYLLVVPRRLTHARVARGDVVVLKSPGHAGELAVKRVIGLPGDCVTRARVLPQAPCRAEAADAVSVRPGSIFVAGDNANRSVDSRSYGALPISDIKGFVVAVVWPLPRLRSVI